MNLRKNWKRFWTLNVHNHEGFTLVELIIVIAILAILSSVAVVGYSSYVAKANMQADKTMVADIINTLTLAYYSEEFSGVSAVILSSGNAKTEGDDSFVANALNAEYGSNWREQLKLKYNGWGDGAAVSMEAIAYFQAAASDASNLLGYIYNGTYTPSFADEVDDLFTLLLETAEGVGAKLESSGADLVQSAAGYTITNNSNLTAEDFAGYKEAYR